MEAAKMEERDLLEKATQRLTHKAEKLLENDCASLRGIKSLKEWHEADYVLCGAREFDGISKEQYDRALAIFSEWWKRTTGRSVIRTFSELNLSELTGITEEQRLYREEAQERLAVLLRRQSELIDRYRAGDRSDALLEEFSEVDLKLMGYGIIEYDLEYTQQIMEISKEAAARRREKN
jgi:hypothetical protein